MEHPKKKKEPAAKAAKKAERVANKVLDLVASDSALVAKKAKALAAKQEGRGGLEVQRQKRRYATVADYHAAINPYFATLVDPVMVRGVRIPDEVTMPSATFSLVIKGDFSNGPGPAPYNPVATITIGGSIWGGWVPSSGNPLAYQSMLCPTQVQLSSGTGTTFVAATNSWLLGATACGADVDVLSGYGATGVPIIPSGFVSGGQIGAIPNTFTQLRLVSAALIVACENAVTETSGRFVAVSLPRRATRTNSATTLAQLEDSPEAASVPINLCKPINVVYQPQDGLSQTYSSLYSARAPTAGLAFPGPGGYPSTATWNSAAAGAGAMSTDDDMDLHAPGELWVVAAGLPTDTAMTFQYTIVLNYEGIPNESSTFLLNTAVSKDDPLSLAHAKTMTAGCPKVMTGSQWLAPTVQAPPMEAHRGDPQPTILDRVLGVVEDVGDVGAAVTGTVTKIAQPVAKLLSTFF